MPSSSETNHRGRGWANRSSDGPSSYKVVARVCFLAIVGFLVFDISISFKTPQLNSDDLYYNSASPAGVVVPSKTETTTFGHRKLCPNAIPFLDASNDYATVERAYKEMEAFHNLGGNRKSIETYLTSHIDDTLKRHNVKFIPNDSQEPVDQSNSVRDTIKDLLVKNDRNKRGGYDQRKLPGVFVPKDNTVVNGERMVDVTEPFNLERWEHGLGPTAGDVCGTIDVLKGAKRYDDKFMCGYSDLLKTGTTAEDQQQEDGNGCTVMSIGSNQEWGFEENWVKQTRCSAHTFDCTTQHDPRKPNVDFIHYYPYCISAENQKIEDREYTTYSTMVEKAGLSRAPALFKIDVEGFEFDVLSQMIEEAVTTGKADLLPSQISVEFHYATRMYDVPWMSRTITAAEMSMLLAMTYAKGGYMLVNQKLSGPGCYSCNELLFVRVLCD
mmetsp:Transcript_826/g.1754  ORF Transcript_826/g.1754 Transcript_826/m.1754 type:complete len:440 (-) Transcript_826:187-1506(-)